MAEFAWMDDYDIYTYGDMWAPYYDETFDKSESEVDFLRPLAGDPPRALELAIGTGRVGLPLSQAGVEVVGIDASLEMVGLLRAKPGGERIEVVMGDFADVAVEGGFPLIYLTFNTLFALTSQQRQVECFKNVAGALDPGGRFVLDAFVPDLKRFDQFHTRIGVSSITSTRAHAFELSIHDPTEQKVVSHHVRRLEDGSTVVLPVEIRYVWPSEMDLMARLAGLELEERWDWYDRRPFTERSGQQVSVYRKPS
jgi:SAM-dependent methyltransferase